MPPEQLMGRATCASDLYALGATAIHMHTGRDPSSLPVERMRLRYHDHARLSPGMTALLDKLTDPTPEDRLQSAAEAREALLAPVKAIKTKGLVRETSTTIPNFLAMVGTSVLFLGCAFAIVSSLTNKLTPPGGSSHQRLGDIPITLHSASAEITCEQLHGRGSFFPGSAAEDKGSYTLFCTLHNTSTTHDVYTLGAQIQLFGAKDALIAGQSWRLWEKDAGPLRPGERITKNAQIYKLEEPPTRATITIDQVSRQPATPAPPPTPVEIIYETPILDGIALDFSHTELVMPDRALLRYSTYLRMHLTNKGDADVDMIEVRVEASDAAGAPLETRKMFLNFGVPLRSRIEEVRTLLMPQGTAKVRLVVVRMTRASKP
jgi:serine/threonine protein kinase